jgi:hypothetical protein
MDEMTIIKEGLKGADVILMISAGIGAVALALCFILRREKTKTAPGICVVIGVICLFVFLVVLFHRLDLHARIKKQEEITHRIEENKRIGLELDRQAAEKEAARPAADRLQEKLKEIRKIRGSIEIKRDEVSKVKIDFVIGINMLKIKVINRKEAEGISTLRQAMQDQEIKNDLLLMQSRAAYRDRMQEIEDRLSAAHCDLLYIENKTSDDLKVATVLSKDDMKRIVAQIEVILSKYAPETKKLVINDETDIKMKPVENIWTSLASEMTSASGVPPKTLQASEKQQGGQP